MVTSILVEDAVDMLWHMLDDLWIPTGVKRNQNGATPMN